MSISPIAKSSPDAPPIMMKFHSQSKLTIPTGLVLGLILSLITCGGPRGEKPKNNYARDGLELAGGEGAWPKFLTRKLEPAGQPNLKARLISLSQFESEKAGLLIYESDSPAAEINEYFSKTLEDLKWRILLKNYRPSAGRELINENPELLKKAQLDKEDSKLPENNYLIVGEGKSGKFQDQVTVTVSILSRLGGSQIRLYYKKVPAGVQNKPGEAPQE